MMVVIDNMDIHLCLFCSL